MQSELAIVAHLGAAMVLGWLVGYERFFHGRAAGTQVYCLVSMASCAVTILAGYPALWFGGQATPVTADPIRVIGSILTGVGFLGAGLIVQSGVNVRGLTTAASVWASSAIGILVGVGFYVSAACLTVLMILCMVTVPVIEQALPATVSLMVNVRFKEGHLPNSASVQGFLRERHLTIPESSLGVSFDSGRFLLEFVVLVGAGSDANVLGVISQKLRELASVESFSVVRAVRA